MCPAPFSNNLPDAHRWPDAVVTLHDSPTSDPSCVLVIECQFGVDPEKFYTWLEYLGAARRKHRTWGRLLGSVTELLDPG